MKKTFFIIVLILLVLTCVAVYYVNTYRAQMNKVQNLNKEYEVYYNTNLLGSQLISVINKTMDYNQKNEIQKEENDKYYIDNEENSIKIYIQFIYGEETKTLLMEDISSGGSEAFVRNYSTVKFKCTKIDYHEKTNHVKSLTFEEVN